jgi:hypothetical protein
MPQQGGANQRMIFLVLLRHMPAVDDFYGFATSESDGDLIVQHQAANILAAELRATAHIIVVDVHSVYHQAATQTDERVSALVSRSGETTVRRHGEGKVTEVRREGGGNMLEPCPDSGPQVLLAKTREWNRD